MSDIADIALRLIGAFYAFAGLVATRAGLTSHFLDRAIAAISLKKPPAIETAQTAWLLGTAVAVLAGGIALMLLLDLAAWIFAASTLAQAAYIHILAPRYFDSADPPEAQGRRQTTNAFVIYAAATAFVLWGAFTGRLVAWHQVHWPLLVLAGAALAAHVGHTAWMLCRSPSGKAGLFGTLGGGDADDAEMLDPTQSRRIKVMADYDCHPLWALDEGLYGDIAPEALGLSEDLTRDLNAWADDFTASLNRDDPANSFWSPAQHAEHAARARPLAVRLARERPDLTVFVLEGDTGVVEVRADEAM